MTECTNCGQPFEDDQSFDGSDKYCTIACSDVSFSNILHNTRSKSSFKIHPTVATKLSKEELYREYCELVNYYHGL